MVRGLILSSSGFGNIGDEETLYVLTRKLQEAFQRRGYNLKLEVFSYDPSETKQLHNVDTYSFSRIERILYADFMLIERIVSRYEPFISILSKRILRKNVKLFFFNFNIATTNNFDIKLISKALRYADGIYPRNKHTTLVVKHWFKDKKYVKRIYDISLLLEAESNIKERLDELAIFNKEIVKDSDRLIVITPRAFVNQKAFNNKLVLFFSKLINKLVKKGYKIFMIPHAFHKLNPMENDLLLVSQIYRSLRREERKNVAILLRMYHPTIVKALFSLANRAICMRLHSIINAITNGVYTLPLLMPWKAYNFKIWEIIKTFNLDYVHLKNLSFEYLYEKIKEKLLDEEQERSDKMKAILKKINYIKKKFLYDVWDDIIDRIVA